ncbi:uncharacterized protein LOC393524 [Danio rerio]|uniref:Tetraspanin n=1 Tax=Danio rerio TaxID=7955 RepID=Q6P0W1_DANRE|nr:uncharacterized protein LOC393524 [Danio rerio]AAH56541.1 Zgc:65811 [Danio rerio]AAH65427.1 Zgc:65811 protein [Danio rerio]|eukprot:NP_956846.1 uncharacterized protein LOC393524 [Danio rerio]
MDGCAQISKCFLVLFNIIYGLLGFSLVSLGLWLRFGAETRGFFDIDLNTSQFNIGVMVLMVSGALMLLVSVIGNCGVCCSSKGSLSVFAGLLSVLILIEISAGVMVIMQSGKVSDELVEFYSTVYAQYLNTRSASQAVSLKMFHDAFDCCGVGGSIELFVRDTCPDGNILKQLTFPSCPSVIKDVFNSNAPRLLGGFLGIAGVMMLALVCSCVLMRSVSASRASPPAYVLLSSTPSLLQPPTAQPV